ncbi:L-glutamine:2-deoxy-scyllo-inosose aminotransferase [bacterium BMS3Bbin14]|nr:L-glutamine:2-deoxy-scyllo-inosose aminotransferase [bacterium BMS3Abin13]GBE51692.1 L-glutamine:2-deoxy-scyllo-inosose aminotransferase [bacterium BMS3Bbin14]HDK43507.1 DegT/DnrJ/EryC1/StrS family aminotransferase [Desulfobacteraceae bacterium]HDL98961.1 DegT/DnrJ/EryC1/StrS family aminotransferase [Desulfobacteraceae bacterium]HDO31325.1 DegT/DnrJ/EryC1/StrS family aminotransferase [Desulfobacteraceae bacterium]
MPGFEVFGDEEKREVLDVFDTGVLFRYEFGQQRGGIYKVRQFEEAFAAYTGAGFAQAVTSGTAALKVAMTALGVGAGDEVITQGFTFVATWEAILDTGALPVFTEVDETLNMDPADLERKITGKTRAIIPVHMLGAQARIEEIVAIAAKHNIPVLEDTAQASGARLHGQHLGTFGACGTFSFDAVKTMTTGEGGMIITGDEKLWRAMSEYHDHGHDHAENPGGRGADGRSFIGFNYRMMELQGAIGLAQLAKLDGMVAAQKANKKIIKEAAAAIPGVTFRTILDEEGDSATFLAFMLPDAERAAAVNQVLRDNGAGAINFGENTWHFYPRWEHLARGATLCHDGWPFSYQGKRRVVYDPMALPRSAELMDRTLVYQIPVKLSEQQRTTMVAALGRAADL